MIITGCCVDVLRLKTVIWHSELFLQLDFRWLHDWFRFYTSFWSIINITWPCFRVCLISNWAVKICWIKFLVVFWHVNDVYATCMRVCNSQFRNSQPKLSSLITVFTHLWLIWFKVCTLCNQGFCVEWAIYQPYLTSFDICNTLKTCIFDVFHLFSPLLHLYTWLLLSVIWLYDIFHPCKSLKIP